MDAAAPGASTTGALLSRIRAGDAAAWDPLLARHQGRLRLYVRARLGRALARVVDAEDVVQETWIRAFASLDRFEGGGESAFHRWLATLARHALADAARAARARKRGSGRTVRLDRTDWSAAGGDPVAAGAGPVTRALVSEQSLLLERAYLSLSPNHRRVLALRQFEQKPAREVAALLGITEGAAHALYRRALAAWGEAFEAVGGTAPA